VDLPVQGAIVHWFFWLECSQMLDPLQNLQRLLWRECSQMPDPLQSLQRLLWRECSQMPDPQREKKIIKMSGNRVQ
jgi:hypothetical protein